MYQTLRILPPGGNRPLKPTLCRRRATRPPEKEGPVKPPGQGLIKAHPLLQQDTIVHLPGTLHLPSDPSSRRVSRSIETHPRVVAGRTEVQALTTIRRPDKATSQEVEVPPTANLKLKAGRGIKGYPGLQVAVRIKDPNTLRPGLLCLIEAKNGHGALPLIFLPQSFIPPLAGKSRSTGRKPFRQRKPRWSNRRRNLLQNLCQNLSRSNRSNSQSQRAQWFLQLRMI